MTGFFLLRLSWYHPNQVQIKRLYIYKQARITSRKHRRRGGGLQAWLKTLLIAFSKSWTMT